MSTLDEVLAGLQETNTAIAAVDSKLDEVKSFIDSLRAGGTVTQSQLDAVGELVASAKNSAQKVLSETEELAK